MTPQEVYGLAIRAIGFGMVALSIGICLLPLLGFLGPLFVGLTLLIGSRFFAAITFGRQRRGESNGQVWNS